MHKNTEIQQETTHKPTKPQSFTWSIPVDDENTTFNTNFECHGFQWVLHFIKTSRRKDCRLMINLDTLPVQLTQLSIQRDVHIEENNFKHSLKSSYKHDALWQGWPKNTLLLKDIQAHKCLTVHLTMTILQLVYNKIHVINTPDGMMIQDRVDKKIKLITSLLTDMVTEIDYLKKKAAEMQTDDIFLRATMKHKVQETHSIYKTEKKNFFRTKKMKAMKTTIYGERQFGEYDYGTKTRGEINLHSHDLKEKQCLSERSKIKIWFLNKVKLPQYYKIFQIHGFETFDVIKLVSADQLSTMKITKAGHQMLLLHEISKLK